MIQSRIVRLLYLEASLYIFFENWTGLGYLGALAGEWGIPVGLWTVICASPWLGQMAQSLAMLGVRRQSPKFLTLVFATITKLVWVFPLGLAVWQTHHGGVEKQVWFKWAGLAVIIAGLFGNLGGVTWMAWVRELISKGVISETIRGKFFGTRHSFVMIALIVANATGAFVLGYRPDGKYIGAFGLGVGAVVFGLLSVVVLSRVPDCKTSNMPALQLREEIRHFAKHGDFFRIAWFGSIFQGAVALAGPYFSYYYTHDLEVPMRTVAWWGLASNAGAAVSGWLIGRGMDSGHSKVSARAVLGVSSFLMCLSPVPYLFFNKFNIYYFAPIEHAINGIAWLGFQVSVASLLTEAKPSPSMIHFSCYTALTGVFCFLAVLLGGWIAHHPFEGYSSFRLLFGMAVIARLAVWFVAFARLKLGSPIQQS